MRRPALPNFVVATHSKRTAKFSPIGTTLMIIGVTHSNNGRFVQRLSVSTKVAIGLPPNGERNHPTKLDHFVFLRKKKSANQIEWEVDPELTEHYGTECRELHIMLIDDDIENVFPSSYAWWTALERKCW